MKTKLHPSPRRNRKRALPADRKAGIIAGQTIQVIALERRAKPFDPRELASIVPLDEDIGAFVEAIDELATLALAQHDVEMSFHALATKGSAARGLALLNKLDRDADHQGGGPRHLLNTKRSPLL